MNNNKTAIYRLRFFFDYQCQSCLWCDNEASCEKFDVGPIDATFYDRDENITREPKIKLPTELRDKVNYLSELFDSSLNWNNPGGDSMWDKSQWDNFRSQTMELHKEISNFLGDDFEIIYVQ
jgi:hypothetical protein